MLVAQLSRLQRDSGHTVTVCAYSQCGILGEALAREGIPVHVMGEAHPLRTILRYLRYFRQTRPDVVHCHNPAPTLHAALGARVAGAACVVATRHSLVAPPFDIAAELKFNLFSWFTDWVVGICDITCKNLRATPLARRSRIVRVYNGASAVEGSSAALRDDTAFTVLFVGRIAAVKNLETLVQAAAVARMRVPHVRVWIVGDGAERKRLEVLAIELGVQDAITFWGQQLDTVRFFNAANAVVMSSVSEGLPMSLLQGMSLGLPSVVTAVGGMKEIIDLSRGGIAVPVGDPQSLGEAIIRLAENPELRSELGASAKAAYQQHFTLRSMQQGYDALYRTGRKHVGNH